MFEFFTKNNLISDNQSGFKPGDYVLINFFLSLHEIYQFFYDNLEVMVRDRAVFLDMSKAFDIQTQVVYQVTF